MASAFNSDFSGGFSDTPKTIPHPVALGFHLGFRAAALLFYVFASSFTANYIISFLIVIFLLSLDFWTVKNVSGRLLVGLRWWNFVDEEGASHWRFEAKKVRPPTVRTVGRPSAQDQSGLSRAEGHLFWAALVLTPVVWVLFAFLALLSWSWLVVSVMGAAMSGANLWGYVRCRWSSRAELSSYLSQTLFRSVLKQATSEAMNPQRPTA